MNLTLGFSPCPNDTFMFDALVHKRFDTGGLNFEPFLEDVESLNLRALRGEADITKLSFFTFGKVMRDYELLTSGSALGRGAGPLLVVKDPDTWPVKVALPGKHTTAAFLFKLFFPDIQETEEMIFSDIEDAVLSGRCDGGVIIHENRFTYQAKGLHKVADLGDLWEKETGLPVPLGGIAIKRSLPQQVKNKVNMLLKQSIVFAKHFPDAGHEYVLTHAQEMDSSIIGKHIGLYVNDFSIDLGAEGRAAVTVFLEKAMKMEMIETVTENIFVEAV